MRRVTPGANIYSAIAADGPSTVVYYNLGNAYYRNDNIGKAVVAYERALRIDPTKG